MSRWVAIIVGLLPVLVARAAAGEESPPLPADRSQPVFVRGAVGPAVQFGVHRQVEQPGGFEFQGDFALGLRLRRNLFLHADVFGQNIPSPDITNYGMWGAGPGLTYYVLRGFYLATRVNAFKITAHDTTDSGVSTSWDVTRFGVGVGLSVGGEVWGRIYGMGISANAFLGRAPDIKAKGDLDMLSIELAWSHSFNFGW